MLVRFIESPTAEFGLAYFVGDEVDISDKKQLQLLLDSKVVEPVKAKVEAAMVTPDKEKAVEVKKSTSKKAK